MVPLISINSKRQIIFAFQPDFHARCIAPSFFKNQHGPYRIIRGALLALREVVEDHLVRVFEGSNLACMHRDRCTLAPWDIHLYHQLSGDEDLLGIEPLSQEAKEHDWENFRNGRLTVAEATVLDTERRWKIRAQMRRLRKRALARAGQS